MNKTNEAFEAWWADTGEQSLFALGTTTDEDIKTIAGIAWEAAIREALAETEITTPDVCGEVCARAKLCYGCNKAFDEANKKLNNDHAWLSKDELTQYWKGYGDGKREALANHIPDATKMVAEHKCGGCAKTAADGWALYCVECWEKVEPVKQEPVGYWNGKETAWFEHELCGHPAPDDCTIPLYAAPVDAKAIREALANARAEAYKPYKVKLPTIMVGRNWHSEEIQRWLDELPPLYVGPVAEPVKQEPVAWMKVNDTCTQLSFERFNSGAIPLYAAPVDAKAIRAEALEEAAELGDSMDPLQDGAIGKAIRGLK